MRNFLRRWRLDGVDVFMLFVLLLAGLKFTHGIRAILDVGLYDESNYLHAGVSLPWNGLPAASSAPLYALWYYGLSRLQPDLISLYYLNYELTTILPPLFLYLLLRVNRVPVVASTVLAAYFLITQASFATWPRPTHLALTLILISGIAASFTRRAATAFAWLAVGALLAAYVRPEYLLATLLLLGAGGVCLVLRQPREERLAALPAYAVAFGSTLVLVGTLGSPAFTQGGGTRLFYAFSQHFAINWGAWHHVAASDSYQPQTNFEEITAREFGNATSVAGALLHNPGLFLKHVLFNVKQGIPRLPGMFFHHENVFLPLGKAYENLEARLTILLLLGVLYFQRRTWLPKVRPNLRRRRLLLVGFGLLCVPAAISAVEIYPHDHYLLIPGVLLIAATAIVLYGRDEPSAGLRPGHVGVLALLLLAATPAVSHRPAVETPIADSLRYIRDLHITRPVTELDAEGGYHNYQTANYNQVTEYSKHVGFDLFASRNAINMVVLTPRLEHDSHFLPDPEWQAFLAHYQERGFQARVIPHTEATLLLKNDLPPSH